MRETGVIEGEGSITVAERWTYVWGARRRPYVHPLRTPAGHVLTRNQPDDHPWHHGLWFTVKYIDGDNFWEEVAPYGVLRHHRAPSVTSGDGGRVTVAGTLDWIRPDRTSVALVERRSLTHVPLDDSAYAVDLDTSLVPTSDVVLDRTPFTTWGGYGGLTLRGPGNWHDTRLLLADGTTHDRVIGVRSPWCDLTGIVGSSHGDASAGVTVIDHPANTRHPVPFYASTRSETYGTDGWSNFLNAAFLFHEPMSLAAGEQLRIRHRVVIHDGVWDAAMVRSVAAEWAGP